MLACKTELYSAAWRQGMIDALTTGVSLVDASGLRGSRLYLALLRRFTHLAPPAYQRYRRTYALLGDAYHIYPERLGFWQWRTRAVDLAERVNLSALLSCPPGDQAVQLRRTLLLTGGDPNAGTYSSLATHGHACVALPNETDGQIDGYQLCCRLMYEDVLDGDCFVDAVIEYLDAFWPEDYRRYRYRYAQLARQACLSQVEGRLDEQGLRLEYRHWSSLVGELHDEIRRCRHAGSKASRRQRELSRLLLCQPRELPPGLDWTVPPKLQVELSC
jgi:hypothetical protein